MKIPIIPGKYHQNGGFSMAMLVSGRVVVCWYLFQVHLLGSLSLVGIYVTLRIMTPQNWLF